MLYIRCHFWSEGESETIELYWFIVVLKSRWALLTRFKKLVEESLLNATLIIVFNLKWGWKYFISLDGCLIGGVVWIKVE